MPFNWFKRQFGGKKDEASKQETSPKENLQASPEKAPEPPKESAKPEAPADTTPTNAEDYLLWAKAAYQNIQKQKDETPSDSADEAVQDESAQDQASQDEVEAAAPPESVEETATPESTEEVSVEPETTAESTSEQEAPDETSSEPEAEASDAVDEAPTATAEVEPTVDSEVAIADSSIEPDDSADITSEVPPTAASAAGPPPETTASEALVEPVSSPETTPEAQSVEPEADAAANITETIGETETTAQTDSAETSESVAETIETTETVPDTDDKTAVAEATEPDASTEEAVATALPFWAKAEAERQERLEKLKETAIEEPEPEPEVELDEDFIWSAGVLASQGRKADEVSVEEITWLTKLRQGLGKTRRGLINELKSVVGQGPLNADAVMEIESLLLQADVGIDATDYVIEALQARMKESALPPEEAIAYLKEILRGILDKPFESDYSDDFIPEKDCLNIWLLTGVNGAGKTTTIGKLAHMTRTSDYRCLIAAADTFRAAAVEQVKVWGERSGVEVIANPGKNTDPAAVVFDAISAAQARDVELLLVDTAGRLQNKKNLMAELSKIRRIVDKKAANAKVESLLVLDATLGQNGLRQAQVFSEAAKLSGVVLTKLDGSAKGGVALAVVQQLGLPIRFIGAGEGIEDLRPFSSYEFVEALLSG